MGIGVGIFLLAFGAVLAFAVDWTPGWLDLRAVGWIMMAAGVIGLVLFFYFWNRRRASAPAAEAVQTRADPGPYHNITPAAPPGPGAASAPTVASAPVVVPAPARRAD